MHELTVPEHRHFMRAAEHHCASVFYAQEHARALHGCGRSAREGTWRRALRSLQRGAGRARVVLLVRVHRLAEPAAAAARAGAATPRGGDGAGGDGASAGADAAARRGAAVGGRRQRAGAHSLGPGRTRVTAARAKVLQPGAPVQPVRLRTQQVGA